MNYFNLAGNILVSEAEEDTVHDTITFVKTVNEDTYTQDDVVNVLQALGYDETRVLEHNEEIIDTEF